MPNPDRFRCPQCRTRRTDGRSFLLHLMQCPRPLCHCGGYHFAHRPFSGLCYQNPASHVVHASRAGTPDDELADIAIDVALTMPGRRSTVCPF